MKDKIIQIATAGNDFAVLTQFGRVLISDPTGEWSDITPPKELIEVEDVPRFKLGKHKGEPIVDAEPSYVDWCRENIEGFFYEIVDGKLIDHKDDLPF